MFAKASVSLPRSNWSSKYPVNRSPEALAIYVSYPLCAYKRNSAFAKILGSIPSFPGSSLALTLVFPWCTSYVVLCNFAVYIALRMILGEEPGLYNCIPMPHKLY